MHWLNSLWKLECEGWQYLYVQDRCNDKVPSKKGIYCFVDLSIYQTCEVVYVGRSDNFSSRLKFPHTIESRTDLSLLCYIQECDNNSQLEIDFIKRYKPKFNIHHNG